MELELYAQVPDGYELVGFRAPKSGETYLDIDGDIITAFNDYGSFVARVILRKIKPLIKRSFRVDVLDEPERMLNIGESGIHGSSVRVNYPTEKSILPYTPCIVTELPVDGE